MSEATEFRMQYPCRISLAPDGIPELIIVNGAKCVCLFQDAGLMISFSMGKYGITDGLGQIDAWTSNNPDELANLLAKLKPQLASQDCTHIAVDPGAPDDLVLYAGIDELISVL